MNSLTIKEHAIIYDCFINLLSTFNSMTNGVQHMQLPRPKIECVQPPMVIEHGWHKDLQNNAKFKSTVNINILNNTNKICTKHRQY